MLRRLKLAFEHAAEYARNGRRGPFILPREFPAFVEALFIILFFEPSLVNSYKR
jgi:hypothetical protein